MFNLQNVGAKLVAGFVYSLFGGVLLGILYMVFSFAFIFVDWVFNIIGSEIYFALFVLGIVLLFYIIGSWLFHRWDHK